MKDNSLNRSLFVLSDLHLGEGLRFDVPRYSSTEDFFFDDAFARFLEHLQEKHAPDRMVLVLNGDVFDFLTVTRVPAADEARRRGFVVTQAEIKFGLNPTAKKSVYKLDVIARGHRVFFEALGRFVAKGYRVEILRGNHDLDLYFPEVRERILEHLVRVDGGPDAQTAASRVRFHDWFYLERGRVYIEHGNQYDTSNSNRYPLRPLLPSRRWWRAEEEATLDYPLGSIFVRFIYNRVRRIDPYSPRLLSFEQYIDLVQRYNLFDVWRVYRDHYPYFAAALGPRTITGSSRSSEEHDELQENAFQQLSDETQTGDLYRLLNELKIHPAAATKPAVVKEMAAPVVRRTLWLGLFSFVAIFAWVIVFQLINLIPWITANAFLMALFAVLTVGVMVWAWSHFRRKLSLRQDASVEHCAQRAERISKLARVPLVLMGHTHCVDYRKVNDGQAVYANGGTWTSVANPWSRIMRDARRLTFLEVEGSEVHLRRWNDDAGRVDPVPLFFLEEENASAQLTEEHQLDPEPGREHSWLPSASMSDRDEESNY